MAPSASSSAYDVVAGGQPAERAAWTCHDPLPEFEAIRDAVAFCPSEGARTT